MSASSTPIRLGVPALLLFAGLGGCMPSSEPAQSPAIEGRALERAPEPPAEPSSPTTAAGAASDTATAARPAEPSEPGDARAGDTDEGEGDALPALPRGAPKWVRAAVEGATDAEGRRADGDDSGAVYGVGRARMANQTLARATAENRARAAIARTLDGKKSGWVEAELRGVEIVDHWTDPGSGAIFARARLMLDAPSPDP